MTREQILADLARSRTTLSTNYAALRQELDVRARVHAVVRRNPLAWLGGAAALGWMLAGPKTRTRTIVKSARTGEKPRRIEPRTARSGLLTRLFRLVRLLFPLLKPVISAYAGRTLADVAAKFVR